jgi:hypothetical protein
MIAFQKRMTRLMMPHYASWFIFSIILSIIPLLSKRFGLLTLPHFIHH